MNKMFQKNRLYVSFNILDLRKNHKQRVYYLEQTTLFGTLHYLTDLTIFLYTFNYI